MNYGGNDDERAVGNSHEAERDACVAETPRVVLLVLGIEGHVVLSCVASVRLSRAVIRRE